MEDGGEGGGEGGKDDGDIGKEEKGKKAGNSGVSDTFDLKFERVAVGLEMKKSIEGGGAEELAPSLLSKELESNEKPAPKETIPLKIYLPNKQALEFRLDEEATVELAIEETLKEWVDLEATGGARGLKVNPVFVSRRGDLPQCMIPV